jgi:hypothetical protein
MIPKLCCVRRRFLFDFSFILLLDLLFSSCVPIRLRSCLPDIRIAYRVTNPLPFAPASGRRRSVLHQLSPALI